MKPEDFALLLLQSLIAQDRTNYVYPRPNDPGGTKLERTYLDGTFDLVALARYIQTITPSGA